MAEALCKIAAVHSSSIKYSKSNRRIFLLRTLSLFYRYFENIICISDSIKYDLIDNYNVSQHRLVKIANPIITNHSKKNDNAELNLKKGYKLLVIGRLVKQKNIDQIIKVFKRLNDYFEDTILC